MSATRLQLLRAASWMPSRLALVYTGRVSGQARLRRSLAIHSSVRLPSQRMVELRRFSATSHAQSADKQEAVDELQQREYHRIQMSF